MLEPVDFPTQSSEFLFPLLECEALGVEVAPERSLLGRAALDPLEFRAQARELLFKGVAFACGPGRILDGLLGEARLRIGHFAIPFRFTKHALEFSHRLVTRGDEHLALLHQCTELTLVLGLQPCELGRRGLARPDERLG